jgi:TRAP-type C4-dicarboxylate transport system permease small subunit
MKETLRKQLGTICLVIATFLNPFGYDILVYKLTQLTGDYWTTMHILYAAAVLFFTLFFIFYKINPIKTLTHRVKKITTTIKPNKK